MSTATTYVHAPASEGRTRSWWGRVLDGLVAGQMEVARRQISEHLRFLSDSTLVELGFSEKEIAHIRAGRWVNFPR